MNAQEKFFRYIHGEYRNEKGGSNLLTPDNKYYYLGGGVPIEYSEGSLGKVPLYGITVIFRGSMVNEFSCCFTKEWKAKTYLRCLIDDGIHRTVKGVNVALSLKNKLLKQESCQLIQ